MRIFLDERELEPCEGSIAKALDQARLACEMDHRIICDVYVDDDRLTDDDIQALSDTPRDGAVLRCKTTNPTTLVLDTLEYMDETLGQLRSTQEEVAQKLQAGSTEAALSMLTNALAQWADIRQGVDQGCRLLGMDFDAIRQEEQQVAIAVEVLTNSLQDLREAVALNDWSRLSDTLGYEMPDVIVRWRDLVEFLSQRVSDHQRGEKSA